MTSTFIRSYYLMILLVFFTSCDATIANWIGSRGFKGSPESAVADPGVLNLSPVSHTLAVNNNRAFVASGGIPPYTYSVISGGGTIGASTGIYVAGVSAGSAMVKVQDSAGASALASITINEALSLTNSTVTQFGSPGIAEYFGQTTITGGVPPFSYSTLSGGGTINSSTGIYTLPASWLTTQVRITDSVGNTANVQVEDAPVLVNGSITSVAVNGNTAYLGGSFTRANPIAAPGVVIVNEADGTIPSSDCNYKKKMNVGAYIYSMASDGISLFIAGVSSYGGKSVGDLIKIDLATCELDTTFTQATGFAAGSVNTLVLNSGSLFVGGSFTTYRGVAAPYLVKLSATTGNIDTTFNTGSSFDSGVVSIAYSAGALFVAGNFTTYGGTAASKLAKLNATTGILDTTFTQATGFSGTPRKLSLMGSSVYLCGQSASLYRGASVTKRILKLDTTSGNLDTGFVVTLQGTGKCYDISNDGTNLYIAGEFSGVNDGTTIISSKHIAKVNGTSGIIDSSFSQVTGIVATGVGVDSIFYFNNKVLVGAYTSLDSYRGSPVSCVFRLDASNGNLDTTFNQNFGSDQSSISYVSLGGGKIAIGGGFTFVGGSPAMGLAKMDLTTNTIDTSFSSTQGFDGGVLKVLYSGGSLYVGGMFTTYRGSPANYLAKLNPTTGALDTTFTQATGANGMVREILAANSSLYIGGGFSAYRGSTALYLAKVDPTSGNLDTTFTQATGFTHAFTPWVRGLATDGSALFVAGYFTGYRGANAYNVAKLNWTNGNLDTTFTQATGLNGTGGYAPGYSLLYLSGSLYIGGSFNSYRGTTVANLVKVDPNSGNLDTTFSQTTGTNSSPTGIISDGTSLFILGNVTMYRGATTYGILKLDPTSGNLDSTFSGTSGFDGSSYAFIPKTASVYFSFGSFFNYRGKAAPYIVPISTTNGSVQ